MKNAFAALLLILAAAARPCAAAPRQAETRSFSAVSGAFSAGEDTLVKQIRFRALTQPNGGITAAVRVATGQSIPIETVGLDVLPVSGLAKAAAAVSAQSLSSLRPRGALAPAKSPRAKARPAKKAAAQLRAIQEFDQDWGEGTSKSHAGNPERRKSR